MTSLVYIYYHGEVTIEPWEWALSVVYLVFIYLYFARRKNQMMLRAPEYRYYLWGLMAKIAGGVVFSLIYFYYYPGGDTTGYFYASVAMRNMAFENFSEYFTQMMGDNSERAWLAYSGQTSRPYRFLFFDDRTFVVLRVVSIFAIFTFKSYLITTLLIASMSFFGVWAAFRTFVSYFPQMHRELAVGFLFVPSTIFWGSGILKDTFTFSAVCMYVHCVDEIFFQRRKVGLKVFYLVLASLTMILIKPYIFMVLFPISLLWIFYFRVTRLRNMLIKFVVLPVAIGSVMVLSLATLSWMGDKLDKFALDVALDNIIIVQADLSNEEAYGANSFDVGTIDDSWSGVLAKFPVATNAALFRPYLWEAKNVMMALSGLENLWFLLLAIGALVRAGPIFAMRVVINNPMVLMSLLFAVMFAFIVGITTPNFGALVRFRIPMVPLFIASLSILNYLVRLKRQRMKQGKPFVLEEFRTGTAHLPDAASAWARGGRRPAPGRGPATRQGRTMARRGAAVQGGG